MYDKALAATGPAVAGGGLMAIGSPLWLILAGFAVVATATAVTRIVPKLKGRSN